MPEIASVTSVPTAPSSRMMTERTPGSGHLCTARAAVCSQFAVVDLDLISLCGRVFRN